MAIKVYADAGSNLFPSIIKAKGLDIQLVKMKLFINDECYDCYDDNFDFKGVSKLFYKELSGDNNIRTSLVNPNDFMEAFKEDVKAGHQILVFTMAKGISGTYQSACIARDTINEEQGKEVVAVVDSATAGFGEGIQAMHAAEEAKAGKSFAAVVKEAEKFKFKVRSEFTVDDIGFLAKTGRVSKAAAKIATMFRIKPLLKGSVDSEIVTTSKVSGRKMAVKRLIKQCIDYIRHPEKQIVYITHCNCYNEALEMKKALNEANIPNVEIYDYDLVTGSHLGPNGLAIFYVGKDREFKTLLQKLKSGKKEEEVEE